MENLVIENQLIPCRIEKIARKTLAIKITNEGVVLLSIPKRASVKSAIEFAQSQSKWILEKREEVINLVDENIQSYKNGRIMYFLGDEHFLEIQKDTKREYASIELIDDRLILKTFDDNPYFVQHTIETWYKIRAKHIFETRTRHFAEKLNLRYNQIRIKNQKTRWGSCSAKKNLNYNMRLIMGPFEIIDYIIVHELCHLVHLNHSSEFWSLVGSIQPDYKERRSLLETWTPKLQF